VSEPTIVLTDAPQASDVAVIGEGLAAYNVEQTGVGDSKRLAVLVKDAAGKTVGGISGRPSLGLLFVDLVYLPKSMRGGGAAANRRCSTPSASRRRSSTSGSAGA
jgi:hypothetical protein